LIRPAKTSDAKILHDGFTRVVDEGRWLPSLKANASVQDWVSWIARTSYTREVILVAFIEEYYVGHLTLQPEEWMASGHVAKLGIIVLEEYRNMGVGRALMNSRMHCISHWDIRK
jgi:GNAT superfamily N-acetyltransferase